MSFKSNLVIALFVFYFILFYFLHRRGLWLFEKTRARNKAKPIMTSIGDKISCTALEGLCDVLPTSKGENEAFPPPPPPSNVVSLYTIPVTDTPTLIGGKGRGASCFVLWNKPFEDSVSTILLPIVGHVATARKRSHNGA